MINDKIKRANRSTYGVMSWVLVLAAVIMSLFGIFGYSLDSATILVLS